MEKKPYTPPTLTDHGNVAEKTMGAAGYTWEYIGIRMVAEDMKKHGIVG